MYSGGGKKRKKKNYTTPKKIKHKHRKVKLAVLKYYKVDDNGKINRLRRECPAEECGAGVFMAAHFDRWGFFQWFFFADPDQGFKSPDPSILKDMMFLIRFWRSLTKKDSVESWDW